MRSYGALLRHVPLGPLFLAGIITRLPQTMESLALVLFVRQVTGSFGTAGLATGGLALGTAVGGPAIGRLTDRRGAGILLPTAIGHAALLTTLVIVGGSAANFVLIILATLVGAAMPPAHAVLRARLPMMLATDNHLLAPAYALDSVLVEVTFVGGPLLTALLVAVGSPQLALLCAAAAAVIGAVIFLALLPPLISPPTRQRGSAGPLRSPVILMVVLAMLPTGIAFGTLEVAIPAFSDDHGAPEMAGLLLAIWSVGSIIGGLYYGARHWSTPIERRHLWMTVVLPLGYIPMLGASSIALMAILVIPAGTLIAPLLAARNELVGAHAPPGTETEALTWPTTMLLCGIALGASLSGLLVDQLGWRAPGLLAIAVTALGGVLVAAHSRRRPAAAAVRADS